MYTNRRPGDRAYRKETYTSDQKRHIKNEEEETYKRHICTNRRPAVRTYREESYKRDQEKHIKGPYTYGKETY